MITPLLFVTLSSALHFPQDLSRLDDLEHRAVNFFWEQSNPETGFSKDRATNADRQETHDVASCASVGFALVAYAIGAERKWIPRKDALERTKVTLDGLINKWPQEHGWLYHFIDYEKGTRIWECEASSIDTSICLAGVLAAQEYWSDRKVDQDSKSFLDRIDWKWMLAGGDLKSNQQHLSMGWHPGGGFIDARWNDYNESKMLYIQAYGSSDIPTGGWDAIRRPELNFHGIDLIQGGPLFMHEMSESFYPFKGLRDRLGFDYSVAERNAALANRAYCMENPKKMAAYGPDFWGLSACDAPDGYSAFGAPGNINDDGTITPTSPIAAVAVTPNESLAFFDAMRKNHPEAWGKYGFPNGYCPQRKWTGPDVIGIDLGMMMCGVENARTGFVWRLSMKNPIVRKGYDRAGMKAEPSNDRLWVK